MAITQTQAQQYLNTPSQCDSKEQKHAFEDNETETETESSDEVEFYWDLFNIDLFDIIHKDLKSLHVSKMDQYNQNNENKRDSIFLSTDEKEMTEKQKQLKENGRILISNVYGKMFVLYHQFDTLIAFDSIQLPIRGIAPPNKLYRGFNDIKANQIRLPHNEEYITLCCHTSCALYHISQFFTETKLDPIWQIKQSESGIILDFDWNIHSIFLVIEVKNKCKQSEKHKYILSHYSLSGKYYEPPKYCGNVSIPPCVIMGIKLLSNDTLTVCLRNGLAIFYKYSNDAKYDAIHSIDITEYHTSISKTATATAIVPFLITEQITNTNNI